MELSVKWALVSAVFYLHSVAVNCYCMFKANILLSLVIFTLYAVACVVLFHKCSQSALHCAACASLLGSLFAYGVYLNSKWTGGRPNFFGTHLCLLSIFHFAEFLTVALCSGDSVSIDSFLLNHSVAYWAAAFAGWLEYSLELFLFPNWKQAVLPFYCGLFLSIVGELLRKGAIINAGASFSHTMRFYKSPEHTLITSGLYSLCRHPAYLGWLLWSIGCQLVLVNPCCTVLYAFISWKFLSDRIAYEEKLLLQFFGKQYLEYRRHVPSGVPFT